MAIRNPFFHWLFGAFVALVCQPAIVAQQLDNSDLLLSETWLPTNMKVVRTTPISAEKIAALSKTYGSQIAGATQQVIDVDQSLVQLTVVDCASLEDRTNVYSKYVQEIGRQHMVLPGKGNTVFEIQSIDLDARRAVAELLPIEVVQIQKLQPGEYPRHWLLIGNSTFSQPELTGINKKLNIAATGVVNQIFRTGIDTQIQVNTMTADTPTKAVELHRAMTKLVGDVNTVLLHGRAVFELISNDDVALKWVTAALHRSATAKYRVTFRVSPIRDASDVECTSAFNAFLRYELGDKKNQSAAASDLAGFQKKFTFSNQLRLQASTRASYSVKYDFHPEPSAQTGDGTDLVVLSFSDLPKIADFPNVTVVADYETKDRFLRSQFPPETLESADRKRLIVSTPRWPTDDPQIQRTLARIVSEDQTDLEKVMSLHSSVFQHIRFAGAPKGSRFGVEQVLAQRYGHCWDKSDVYVTLARAAGIPTRQLAGWVIGASGHVWSESYIDGIGWLPVDATVNQVGVNRNYLSLFSTDDGEMKILYTALPLFENPELENPELENPEP